MSDEHWTLYIIIFAATALLMARLDRLGKQLEAVSTLIRSDVARTKEQCDEIHREWKENQQQATKDARQFWTFWGIVGAAAAGWFVLTHYR